jgi:2',3'-cyclic-nucleotide 2'-phosphodiesterase (5'-nucleotidase family)
MRLRPIAVSRTIAGLALAIVCCFYGSGIEARQVPITILHTCDLHGHILPTENYAGQTNLGGLARCATVIRQVRAEQPHTLLVDAGDTIQGAPVSYLSGGQALVTALNLLHYDAWIWGNHEFDWGL